MIGTTEIILGGVGLAAGFVDAIAGGGGLLTVPALWLTGLYDQRFVGLQNPQAALATNKGQSVWGSGMAFLRFYHSPLLDRKRMGLSFLMGFVGAVGGVFVMLRIPRDFLQPVVMVMLMAVGVFMIFYRPPMTKCRGQAPPHARVTAGRMPALLGAVAIAAGIGFYDGFFGPGTGVFLILAFVLYFKDLLHEASANAKVVNFASNLGAVAVFLPMGLIEWRLALPMAVGQAVGGWMGAHVTVRRGVRLVRVMLVVVSLAMVARLAWQLIS